MKSPICFFFLISFLVHAGVRHSSVLLRYTRQGDFESTVSRCKSNENKKKGGDGEGKVDYGQQGYLQSAKNSQGFKFEEPRRPSQLILATQLRTLSHPIRMFVHIYIYSSPPNHQKRKKRRRKRTVQTILLLM